MTCEYVNAMPFKLGASQILDENHDVLLFGVVTDTLRKPGI
jgi:hypothetical protein